jgi:hypothetical protein
VNPAPRDQWKEDGGDGELLNRNEIPHGGVEQEWWRTCFASPWGWDGSGAVRRCGARRECGARRLNDGEAELAVRKISTGVELAVGEELADDADDGRRRSRWWRLAEAPLLPLVASLVDSEGLAHFCSECAAVGEFWNPFQFQRGANRPL